MEKQVLNTIRSYNLITENDNILIAVSGGYDSMALLYLLMKARKYINFNIHIAHVNHGVRNEAIYDEIFVERTAKKLGLPYYSKRVDMDGYAREKSISSEEAGRELRYGFFREVLASIDGDKIAVAHNMDDQAETLLMRIMRGTGIDGLKGMEFKKDDVIRPILNISRDRIEEYIELNNIETVLDKTNLLPIYTRNKIRLELIPYIKENFNPNITEALWRLSENAYEDNKFLENYLDEKYNLVLKVEKKDCIILHGDLFRKEKLNFQQRLIRRVISNILGDIQGFSSEHINMIVDLFSTGQSGKKLNLPNNLIAKLDYRNLIIKIRKSSKIKDFQHKLEKGKNDFQDLGYRFNVQVLSMEEVGSIKRYKDIAYFDYDEIQNSIYVRNRQEGDRFTPFGMKGSKKLKDFFIDEKISRDLRQTIHLVVDEENILWVVGYRTNDLYKITKDTKKVLMIEYFCYNTRED